MATRPDTLHTTVLAIELLRRIPRNRKVTAAELHKQLQHVGHRAWQSSNFAVPRCLRNLPLHEFQKSRLVRPIQPQRYHGPTIVDPLKA